VVADVGDRGQFRSMEKQKLIHARVQVTQTPWQLKAGLDASALDGVHRDGRPGTNILLPERPVLVVHHFYHFEALLVGEAGIPCRDAPPSLVH